MVLHTMEAEAVCLRTLEMLALFAVQTRFRACGIAFGGVGDTKRIQAARCLGIQRA